MAALGCSYCFILLLLLLLLIRPTSSQQFNYEIEKRILDRLRYYLGDPVRTNAFLDSYLRNGGFVHDLRAPDRDAYLTSAYSLEQPLIYYGLEDGLCVGYYWTYGYYREPGNGGYDINDESMQKHLKSCVNAHSGEPEDCLLKPGENYIKWTNGGALQPCNSSPNHSSDCSSSINQTSLETAHEQNEACGGNRSSSDTSDDVQQQQKWCRQYMIETAQAITVDSRNGTTTTSTTSTTQHHDTTGLGYVPLTNYCHDIHGRFTQDLGVVKHSSDAGPGLGNCYFGDGKTLVNRRLTNDYAYCAKDNSNSNPVCDNTFAGGYQSGNYDPRYRPWYITTKLLQRPNWSPPYPFFHYLQIGVTYSHPIYTIDNGKQVFNGVLAVDYRFDDIAAFLKEGYGNTSTSVVIYEDAEPHYIIGTSTGSHATRNFLSTNLTEPCPSVDDDGNDNTMKCTPLRVPMEELSSADGENDGATVEDILVRAFEVHKRNGYPQELLSVRAAADDKDEKTNINAGIYVSQSTLYEQSGANLKWRVIIIQPGQKSTTDAITRSSPLFLMVCLVGAVGLLFCILFFYLFYSHRGEVAMIHADWRFTCAFIFGCALLNLSTFTLLGPNTNFTCLLRMWTFHTFFVIALSPLFIKIWRMKQLVGQSSIKRVTISNKQAASYNLPIILLQLMLLSFVTVFDPPVQTEIIENNDGVTCQHIVCSTATNTLFIVEMVFEAGFVLVGCILAYQTRAMNEKFRESRQLIFAMYNIAFVGVMIIIVINVAQIAPSGVRLLQSIGVFWGTVFSSAVFVIPRMMQVKEDVKAKKRKHGGGKSNCVHVTGIDNSTTIIGNHRDDIPPQTEAIRQYYAPESLTRQESATSLQDRSQKQGNDHFGAYNLSNALVVDDDTVASTSLAAIEEPPPVTIFPFDNSSSSLRYRMEMTPETSSDDNHNASSSAVALIHDENNMKDEEREVVAVEEPTNSIGQCKMGDSVNAHIGKNDESDSVFVDEYQDSPQKKKK